MKQLAHAIIFLSVFIFCFTSSAIGQPSKKTSPTWIQGVMTNAPRGFFLLEIQGKKDTVPLNKNGQFEIMLEQHQGNYFTIEYQRQQVHLYVLPFDTLRFTLNGSNLSDVKEIKGKSAAYIEYLLNKTRTQRLFQTSLNQDLANGMNASAYYQKVDSVRNYRLQQLQSESNRYVSPFVENETKAIGYQMANDLLAFKSQNLKVGNTDFPSSFDAYIQQLKLDDESAAYVNEYIYFIQNFFGQKALERYYADNPRSTLKYYEYVVDESCKGLTSEKLKSFYYAELMPQVLKDVGTQDLTNLINRLQTCCKDEVLLESIKRYASQFEHLYPGKPAPDASAYDINGKTYQLSSFKGRVLYIDVWATWCGPCKREIPHLQQLEQEYHGKDIEFISISTDRDINAWKNFLEKETMSGLQLHQSDNPSENMSNLYMVNSIPRFILIDKQGKIVSSDAPRPSSGETIRKVLNQELAR